MRKIRVTRSFIPNFFTLMNLFSGFVAITLIAKGNITEAAWFIVLAGIFDALDGVMARLTKSASEFGVELDSLCDAVSFGVVPSFMIYQIYFQSVEHYGIVLAALPAMAGVMRLARFNVQLQGFEDKKYFRGMPIPAGALTLISYTVFYHNGTILPDEWKPFGMVFVTLMVSAVMVSTIKYDNLPRPSKRSFVQRPIVSILFAVGIIAVIISKGSLLFPFMLFYIVAGFIRHIVWELRGAPKTPVAKVE